MAFDPDEYLNEKGSPFTATTEFDPDAYLSELDSEKETEFDPDAYLEEPSPVAGLRVPEAPPIVERPVEKTEEGILRKAADVPVRFLGGTAGVLKSVADVFGADSPASQDFAERQRFFQNLVSESGKEKDKRAAEIIKSTEDAGLWERAKSAGKAFLESPSSMLATGAGSLAPFIATAGVGTAARLGAAGVRGLQVAAGAISGAGTVKGEIYDAVKQAAIDAGKTPEEAETLASEAQSYGENPEQILAGGAIGALAASTGIEATAGRAISGAARKLATGAQIVGKNVAQEVVTEVPQEAQTALAKNFALQKAGFDVPTLQGVVEAGTTAGIVAAALGGAAGGIDAIAAASENAQKVKLAVNTQSAAQQVSDVAPLTASVVSDQAEVVGREGAEDLQTEADQKITEITQETPEQRVARLQEEATAAAGIELEKEPPVSGFPPERIKSARWFESASRNRLKELQDKDDAGVEDFTTQERDEFEFLKASPTPEQVAERYGYQVRKDVEPTTVTPTEPATAPTPAESLLTRKSELDAEAKRLGADNISSFNSMYATRENLTEEQRNLLNQYGEYNKQVVELGWRDAAKLDDADFGRWEKIKLTTKPVSDQELTDLGKLYLAFNERGETQKAESVLKSIQSGKRKTNNTIEGWFKATDETLTQEEIDTINRENQDWNDSVDAMTEILGRKTPPEEISPADIAPTLTPTPAVTPPAEVVPTPEVVTPTPEIPNLEPLRRVARAEQTEEDVSGLVGQGLVELYNGQPVITQAGLEALPEAERPRLNPEARKIQIDTRTSDAAAEAISKGLRVGVDQVPFDVRMPAGWTLVEDIYVPPSAPEVRESRREPSVEIRQQYTPKTEEEQQSFDRASTNKILARSPQLAVAAVRMKNGEITAGEYADLVDVLDPFVVKGAEPVPTNEKIYQYMSKTAGAKPDSEQGRKKLAKIGAIKEDGTQRIPNGKLAEFRIDIPTYNESTKNGDTVYSITGHEPVSETAKQVGETIAHLGVAKITNPQFITRTISGKGDAVQIAMGAGKFPLATVKGNYEAITELPSDINDPDAWTEAGYNPVRSSELVDVRSKQAVVGGTEAIMVGSRVFVKNAKLEARPTGVTMGERYSKIQMPRPAGMESEAVTTKLESLGFGRGGIVSVVNEPDASFEGRTIIRDGKVVGIELNAAALKDDAAVERVLNHEIAESANADGALNRLVAGLTPKERKEINDAITRLGYAEKARTAEEAARAVELLAEGWRGRKWFDRAVARVEAWANKLGYKLTRRAAEYIAARNVSEINAEFKQAYNKFINVQGEAREGRAFVTPAENARFLELAQNPEANREELQKMVDAAAQAAGNVTTAYRSNTQTTTVFDTKNRAAWFTDDLTDAQDYASITDIDPETVSKYYLNTDNFASLDDPQIARQIRDIVPNMNDLMAVSDAMPQIRQRLGDKYDGIKVTSFSMGYETTHYNPFNPERIKSADPVTRDDQGNIIPLSERFQPTEADIRFSIRESRREDAIPTFSEGSPEAATLTNMKESMAKVDAASEAKPNPENKPTYKISEIASVWMDQGGDSRQLQDMVVEYTNLTPANAKKVANAIAKQYGLQQRIAETGAVIAEPAPEAEGAPRKTSVQRLIEQAVGVRRPIVKLEVNEKTALKDQIRLKAREARETRKARKEAARELAEAVTQYVKDNQIRGPVRARQTISLAKQALKLDVNNEKAVDRYIMYVERVVENANYDKDLSDAKALRKRAKQIAKNKNIGPEQKKVLEAIGNINPSLLDNPFEYNVLTERYLLGFLPVTSARYSVMPDAEARQYLESLEEQMKNNQAELDRAELERFFEAQAGFAEQRGLSLEEAQELLNEDGDIATIIQDYDLEKRKATEEMLLNLAQNAQKTLKTYDDTANTARQKELISFMQKVKLESITPDEKKRFIRFANNVLANGETFGVEQFEAIAKAQMASVEAAKDKRLSKKFAAWISPIAGETATEAAKGLAQYTQSEADTLKNIFGREAVGAFRKLLGLLELDRKQTLATKVKEQIANKVGQFYENLKKKYGEDAVNMEAKTYAAAAGYFIQAEGNKTQEESIAYRRRLWQENIEDLRQSERKSDRDEAELKQKALEALTGNSNAEILNSLKSLNPASYEQLMWWKDEMHPEHKEFLKEHNENFRNQADNYSENDYLSIHYKWKEYVETPSELDAQEYEDPISFRIRQSANSIKRKEHANLPVNPKTNTKANIDVNFGYNQYSALTDQIDRAYTAPAWESVWAFTRVPEFETIVGGRANANFVKNILRNIKATRSKRAMLDDENQIIGGNVALARRLATQATLGGATQPIRQVPDQLFKLFSTSGRWDIIASNIANSVLNYSGVVTNNPLLDKFPISRRGDARAGSQFAAEFNELARKVEASATNKKWAKYKELMNKMGEFWMTPLRASDAWIAKVSWLSYYEAYLNRNNIKMESFEREAELAETDQVRQEAAAQAEYMVDFYAGASDPTKMAALSKQSNNGWREFAKLVFLPLNSFALQQKSALISDARDLMLREGDRKAALAGIVGNVAGMVAFHGIRIYLIGGLIYPAGMAVLKGIFGIDMDEPDEEEQDKQVRDNWRKMKASIYANIVAGGAGQFFEGLSIDAFNKTMYLWDAQINPDEILNKDGEVMSFGQYEKEMSPFYRYRSYASPEYTFGLVDVLTEQAQRSVTQTGQLLSDEEMSAYTPNEQAYAYFSTTVEWLYFFKMMDTDATRVARRLKQDMDRQVKEREAELRAIRNR
jgi:hypothetical protein